LKRTYNFTVEQKYKYVLSHMAGRILQRPISTSDERPGVTDNFLIEIEKKNNFVYTDIQGNLLLGLHVFSKKTSSRTNRKNVCCYLAARVDSQHSCSMCLQLLHVGYERSIEKQRSRGLEHLVYIFSVTFVALERLCQTSHLKNSM